MTNEKFKKVFSKYFIIKNHKIHSYTNHMNIYTYNDNCFVGHANLEEKVITIYSCNSKTWMKQLKTLSLLINFTYIVRDV